MNEYVKNIIIKYGGRCKKCRKPYDKLFISLIIVFLFLIILYVIRRMKCERLYDLLFYISSLNIIFLYMLFCFEPYDGCNECIRQYITSFITRILLNILLCLSTFDGQCEFLALSQEFSYPFTISLGIILICFCIRIHDIYAKYGRCDSCEQLNTSDDRLKWCNDCDTKKYLKESKIIGFCKNPDDLSKVEKRQFKLYGICSYCRQMNTGNAWCNKCDPGRFIREGQTSGDTEMDKLIHEMQTKTKQYNYNLECISFDRFVNIKQVGEGGFSKVYSAIWLDGIPKYDRKKARSKPITVALKKIKDSNNMMEAFMNEIKIHHQYQCKFQDLIQLYGITKDPNTNEFMMVLEYSQHGTLRNYLERRSSIYWKEVLYILSNIAENLFHIHELNYIHGDLHSANILKLLKTASVSKITDLGLSQSFDKLNSSSSSNVCGVIPYIAPEVLNGKPYTLASDIYSFGIIMTEVSTRKPPYGTIPHDENLALAICNGLRPRVAKGTPKCYIDLVNQCLDASPENRPSAEYLYNKIKEQINSIDKDKLNFRKLSSSGITLHPQATYTSRRFTFPKLSEQKNSIGVQIEDPEVPDSDLVKLHISDESQGLDQAMLRAGPITLWTHDATLTLIQQRRLYHYQFELAANNERNAIWTLIANHIHNTHGLIVSSVQCRTKWNTLKRGYENALRILNDGYPIHSPNSYDIAFHDEMSDEFWLQTDGIRRAYRSQRRDRRQYEYRTRSSSHSPRSCSPRSDYSYSHSRNHRRSHRRNRSRSQPRDHRRSSRSHRRSRSRDRRRY